MAPSSDWTSAIPGRAWSQATASAADVPSTSMVTTESPSASLRSRMSMGTPDSEQG